MHMCKRNASTAGVGDASTAAAPGRVRRRTRTHTLRTPHTPHTLHTPHTPHTPTADRRPPTPGPGKHSTSAKRLAIRRFTASVPVS
eukprot:619140-Prymnesium_polylepis.1